MLLDLLGILNYVGIRLDRSAEHKYPGKSLDMVDSVICNWSQHVSKDSYTIYIAYNFRDIHNICIVQGESKKTATLPIALIAPFVVVKIKEIQFNPYPYQG